MRDVPSLMPRDRIQIDLNSPLAREREGVKLTGRSLSARLAEVVERLGRATEAAMPALPDKAWELICWQGWDAIQAERIENRDRPRDVDAMAWSTMIGGVADWIAADEQPEPWTVGLVERLRDLSVAERVAVLERVEAYGRTEAVR